ncbi:SGNH/GDSL hydrolase family protein [Alteribacter natronophilus]|uniref:SGNH/GDSL hydrolase family protein n=1 Tax=Alteribacter natronophilus TaxID=2583810 RepID=UPI00110E30B9|nr:SGNH/GDSL hydrolase family protein [Alteribacter natronophilus]TMW72234.1 SGNH/GDSL hydrolase family protein [Alteribacter natronophilus]
MMKRWVFIIFIVSTIVIIALSKWQYESRLAAISDQAAEELNTVMADNGESTADTGAVEENVSVEDEVGEADEEFVDMDVHPLLEDVMEQALADSRPVEIVAFGSRALTDYDDTGVTPWPELLEEALAAHYGEDHFTVNVYSYGALMSSEVTEEDHHIEVAVSGGDIFLIEPFIWNDNGNLLIRDTIVYAETMAEAIAEENPDAVIALMPSQPRGISQAPNYINNQIVPFREFAEESEYVFLDHWTNWPELDDEEMDDYLDGVLPSQDGHEAWSSYIASWVMNDN